MAIDKEKYRIFEHISEVDISEQDIWDYEPDVLNQLLIDHTMSAKAREEANVRLSISSGPQMTTMNNVRVKPRMAIAMMTR